jgi:hypothetical protein
VLAETAFDILLQPFELLVADLGEAGGFEAGLKFEHVDQADEVHAAMSKLYQPLPLVSLP